MQNNSSQINLGFIQEDAITSKFKIDDSETNNEILENENITELQNSTQTEFKHLEGGYGWLVLIAAIWYYGFCLSTWTNFTLIYPKLIEFYKNEENNITFLAWIGSLSFGIAFLAAFIASFLVDFFGCIKMGFIGGLISAFGLILSAIFLTYKLSVLYHFISFGVIFGLGTSLIMTVPFAILPHYFNKKLGFVNGLLNTGASLILLGYSYLIGYLLDYFEIQITFYVLAGASILIALLSFVFKPLLPNEHGSMTLKKKLLNSLGLEILKEPKFIVWSISLMFGVIGNANPVLTMGHYCSLYFPDFKPEILNTGMIKRIFENSNQINNSKIKVYGISNGVSSIALGKLIDHQKFSKAYNYLAASLAYGIATWLIRYITNFYVYCVIVFIYGVFDAVFICSLMPMAYEVSNGSSKLVNQALGFFNTLISFSVVFGPTISGYYFEKYKDYIVSYNITVGTLILGSIIITFYPDLFILKLYKKLKSKCQARSDTFEIHNF